MPEHTLLVPWEDLKNYISVIVLALTGAIGVLWATYIKFTAKSADAFGTHIKAIHEECKQERELLRVQFGHECEHWKTERELLRVQFGHEREHWKTERKHLVERIEILEALMKRFACDASDCHDRKPVRFRREEEP